MATGIEANAVGLIVGKATPIQEGCKKVAIVGCAETKAQAPFNDLSWELWGVNNLFGHIPRWTRWFEIHSLKYDETKKKWFRRMNPDLKKGTYEWSENFRGQPVNDYIMGLQTMECPVYMQKAWPQIPGSKPYPLKEVLDRFPRQYFTNTISWMLALAIYEGFEEINVYGVDMAVDSEYHYQRPSCEYFLGMAEGLGIKVHIPDEADLLKTRFLYGFGETEKAKWDKKIQQMIASMEQRKANAEQQHELTKTQINQYVGALMAVREVNKIWG
jgi:hypothetical protein